MRRSILAASTHAPEEEIILESFKQLRTAQPVRLMLAPRHPERFNEVAALDSEVGLELGQKNESTDSRKTQTPQ